MDAPARFPSKSTAIAARARGRWHLAMAPGVGRDGVIAVRACGRWPSPVRRRRGLARSPGALAHRCSLTAGFGAGLTEQAVFERRRHVPAGAPNTGELP